MLYVFLQHKAAYGTKRRLTGFDFSQYENKKHYLKFLQTVRHSTH